MLGDHRRRDDEECGGIAVGGAIGIGDDAAIVSRAEKRGDRNRVGGCGGTADVGGAFLPLIAETAAGGEDGELSRISDIHREILRMLGDDGRRADDAGELIDAVGGAKAVLGHEPEVVRRQGEPGDDGAHVHGSVSGREVLHRCGAAIGGGAAILEPVGGGESAGHDTAIEGHAGAGDT